MRERLVAYVDLYVPDGPRDPHWTLWLEVWNRSQNADADARARRAAIEGAWHRDWSPSSPRGYPVANCAPSTPTGTRPACAPSSTASASTWPWASPARAAPVS